MFEIECKVPIPQTSEELEQAIKRYKSTDLQGTDLFCQWQAIRDASLSQGGPALPDDQVADEESY